MDIKGLLCASWLARIRGRPLRIARRAVAAALLVAAVVVAAFPVKPAAVAPSPAGPAPLPWEGSSDPGLSTVPVRLADGGIAELLRPGMRVDVVTLDSGEHASRVLASMATVVTVRAPPADESRLLATSAKGPLVLIAVPTELATQVAAGSLTGPITVTLR